MRRRWFHRRCHRRRQRVAQTIRTAQTRAVITNSALATSFTAVTAATTVHVRLVAACHTVQAVCGCWLHRRRLRRCHRATHTVTAAQTSTILAGHAQATGNAPVAAAAAIHICLVAALHTIDAVGRCRSERWRLRRCHRITNAVRAAQTSAIIANSTRSATTTAVAAAAAVHVRLAMILLAVQTVRRCRSERWCCCRCHRVANTVRAAQTGAIVA